MVLAISISRPADNIDGNVLLYDSDVDLNGDSKVDFADFTILAHYWLTDGERGDEHYYYHYDGLGSVVALSDKDGDTVEKYEYDAYGKVNILDAGDSVLSESSVANPYFFTGRRFDLETGLYYYRARYYSPALGRLKINANNQLVEGQPGQIGIFDGPHSDMSLALGMGETSISHMLIRDGMT